MIGFTLIISIFAETGPTEGYRPPSTPRNIRSKSPMSRLDQTTFLTGANAPFIAELHARWLEDPAAVDESWRSFFADLSEEAPDILKEISAPHRGSARGHIIANRH